MIVAEWDRYHQYNNTKFFASATTKQISNNLTAAYGQYNGYYESFSLPGVPTSLIPYADIVGYGATSFGTFDRFSWPQQSLTM